MDWVRTSGPYHEATCYRKRRGPVTGQESGHPGRGEFMRTEPAARRDPFRQPAAVTGESLDFQKQFDFVAWNAAARQLWWQDDSPRRCMRKACARRESDSVPVRRQTSSASAIARLRGVRWLTPRPIPPYSGSGQAPAVDASSAASRFSLNERPHRGDLHFH